MVASKSQHETNRGKQQSSLQHQLRRSARQKPLKVSSSSSLAPGLSRQPILGTSSSELSRLLSMSTTASSKPGSQEPPTPNGLDGETTLPPDLGPLSSGGANAAEQNAIVLQWMKSRGLNDAAKRLEEEIRSGRAGSDPVVLVNDPASGSDGEGVGGGKDGGGDSSKPLAKRRASARLAKQSQKETITMQELATRAAPKGAVAAQAAAAQASAPPPAAATPATTTAAKKGARGRSPAMRSPITTTHPLRGPAAASSSKPHPTISTTGTRKSETPPAMGVIPTPDLSTLYSVLGPLAKTTTVMTPEENQNLTANLLSTLTRAGMTIDEAMARDPTDKQRGYKDLENWVDGALDMYRPEFRPILFPVFVHFYLELVLEGFKDAATHFFATYSPLISTTHAATMKHLSAITLPHHVAEDELAQRFRTEKYVIRMSRSGFGLLLGWLMEGTGGEAMGGGEGFGGDSNKRGRATIRRILNDRIDVEVTTASTTEVPPSTWETNTGLLSSLIPSTADKAAASPVVPSPVAYNKAKGPLKLGLAPLPDNLAQETKRVLREEAEADTTMGDGSADGGAMSAKARRLQNGANQGESTLVNPEASDMLPRPALFKTIDVKREVEKVRDARKRIRLEPAPLTATDAELGLDRAALFAKSGSLPSVCAYTFHDANDGVCSSVFSPDSSLMASGFNESYVRIWSLKGEKLRGMRSDFNASSIKDGTSMKKVRDKHGSLSKKLIGHSAPVYSVSFDPLSGSAGPPKFLLSCSSDTTTRLWSLDTMTNVVVYRGHQNPVWDVDWSPMGIYFATASRDRTARLWSTDRVTPLRIFAGHMSDVDVVKFHPNALYLATGSSDSTCRLWDVQRGSCLRVLMGHTGAITAMDFSPDGRYLASSATDNVIILWDLGSGRQVKSMTGHTSLINTLSFSACSSMLVSGACDWTVRCWDVKGPGGLRSKRGGKDEIQVDGFGLASRGSINGLSSNGVREEGKLPEGGMDDSDKTPSIESVDLIATFPTKRTPIINVQFTPRNLCLVSGSFMPVPEVTANTVI